MRQGESRRLLAIAVKPCHKRPKTRNAERQISRRRGVNPVVGLVRGRKTSSPSGTVFGTTRASVKLQGNITEGDAASIKDLDSQHIDLWHSLILTHFCSGKAIHHQTAQSLTTTTFSFQVVGRFI